MALPPTIPTSFVPHSPTAAAQRYRFDFIGAFGFLAYFILFIVVAMAIGVFVYGTILTSTLESKDTELATANENTNKPQAESFVRLNDRLNSSQALLDKHVAFSSFFTTLGNLLPLTIRFSSMHLGIADGTKITLEGTGTAKSFNALAAASFDFAADGRIKDAIFSHIVVNKDNSVSFSLSAVIDPKLTTFTAAMLTAAPVQAPPASSATSTTTP